MVIIPEAKTYTYKTDPTGHTIDCDVYLPSASTCSSSPCPVIMWMHYSNLIFDNRHTVGPQLFWSGTQRGYIVVNIDYRLAPQVKMGEIYADIEDAASWIRNTLPLELAKLDSPIKVDTEKLVLGGGSCGALLALTAGLKMQPPPKAVVSLYSLVDPTDPEFNTPTRPLPPQGRTELIAWDEVKHHLDPKGPMVSHPENSLNMREYTYDYGGRCAANMYLVQEGLLLPAVHGEAATPDSVREEWGVVHNMTNAFPPTWVAHAVEDRYTPVTEARKLKKALEREGVRHDYWEIEGAHDHGFDFWEMQAGEEGEFEKEFAGRLWPWLGEVVGWKGKEEGK